ncbi:hypothetical protein QQP08_010097 [Theobroma cacao]|nr:hypothetical protein QQP08_010097 [Theobroma cacao]
METGIPGKKLPQGLKCQLHSCLYYFQFPKLARKAGVYTGRGGRVMRFADRGTAAGSTGGWEKLGNGVPGFSSQLKGTEAISLIGVRGGKVGVTEETPGFQSFFAIPGLTSQRNGTEGGNLVFLLLECSVGSFSAILK